jgi:hypothetical protein
MKTILTAILTDKNARDEATVSVQALEASTFEPWNGESL